MAFGDANTGEAVGTAGTMLRTVDAGASWITQAPMTTRILEAVSFADADIGVAVGGSCFARACFSTILRTTDGGASWTVQEDGGGHGLLLGVSFADANLGVVVGSNGGILRTVDGGASWTQMRVTPNHLYGVSFIDSNTGTVVGGEATILQTMDGGETWTLQE